MNRIYIPTSSPANWRKHLAEPDKQWRDDYSAKELADCWESANGFPAEIAAVFSSSNQPAMRALELLLAIPEFPVDLPGGKRPSQNDLFVLARTQDGELVTIMVEGKVREPFGETLANWLKGASKGKHRRFNFLCDTLGLSRDPPLTLRYQLFHRSASAILIARRFTARHAVLLVHSFSPEHHGFADYQEFLRIFGIEGESNRLMALPSLGNLQLYAGWAVGRQSSG